MSSKIMIVGSLTMDVIAIAQRRPIRGETVLGKEFAMVPGGKGANQAVTSARLGADAFMVGRVGDDLFANMVLENLSVLGVHTEHVVRDHTAGTGIAHIMVDGNGDNSIVMVPRANWNITTKDIDAVENLLRDADALMLQLEIPLPIVEYAAKKAKEHGVLVIFNPAPATSVSEELLRYVDIITPNETEATIITGVSVTDVNGAEIAAREIRKLGVPTVIITMGGSGSLMACESGVIHLPAEHVDVVDTTAAGDAFNGGLAVALVGGRSLREAHAYAGVVGTLAVTRLGAQSSIPSREDVETFIFNHGGLNA